MSAGRVISQAEFAQSLRKGGTPSEAVEFFCDSYGRASVAALKVLPKVRELSFFSGTTEKVNAFQMVCCGLDECVDEGIITQDDAQVALFILFFSSDHFAKAMKAFRNFAHGKNLGGRHLASFTAGVYAEGC